VELVQRTPPTEEDKKDWPEKRKEMRDRKMRIAENQLIEDFCTDLRERMLTQVPIRIDQAAIDDILGRNRPAEEEAAEEATADEDATAAPDQSGEAAPASGAQADNVPAAEEVAPGEEKAAE